jgi:hypothetical protein
MEPFTKEAAALLARMVKAGWHAHFHSDSKLTEWTFQKLCRTEEHGEFWRIGTDADLKKAADAAFADEAKATARAAGG